MKGSALARSLLGRRHWLNLLLAIGALRFAAAQELCTPLAPCGGGPDAPQETEVVAHGRGELAGGSRTPLPELALRSRAPVSLWGRQDFIVGAIDPDHDDDYEYRLPYADAESHPVIQGYGAKLSHRGAEQFTVDFGMPIGTPVHAAREGVVVLLEDARDGGCWRDECARLANFIVVLHPDGTTGEYFHLERGSAAVRVGQRVQRGQRLALSGNTGYSTAPHLHFGVYRAGRDGRTHSVAVRFLTREGPIAEPRTGARYQNLPSASRPEG
jgi:murein DD-endopeptidase MepM/ murein hydrolase activator NlpD